MKQIKPIAERISQWNNADEVIYCCPKCRHSFAIFGMNEKFCHNCGQAINWKVCIRVNKQWSDAYHSCMDHEKQKEIMKKIDRINNRWDFEGPVEMSEAYGLKI